MSRLKWVPEFDNIIKTIDKLKCIDSLTTRQGIQKALNRGEAYHKLKRAVFHAHQGKFRVKTELEQNIWNECARFITNAIIYYQSYILSVLLIQKEREGKQKEADLIKRISPIAWQNINLLGRFEFQKQQKIVDIEEMVRLLEQKIIWQHLQTTQEAKEREYRHDAAFCMGRAGVARCLAFCNPDSQHYRPCCRPFWATLLYTR